MLKAIYEFAKNCFEGTCENFGLFRQQYGCPANVNIINSLNKLQIKQVLHSIISNTFLMLLFADNSFSLVFHILYTVTIITG